MARISFKRNINIGRTVAKIAATIIALWVGGTIITEIGSVMNGTASPFYRGITLIGWSTSTTAQGTTSACYHNASASTASQVGTCITATNGAGILAVVGLIGIASIVMEFVQFRL